LAVLLLSSIWLIAILDIWRPPAIKAARGNKCFEAENMMMMLSNVNLLMIYDFVMMRLDVADGSGNIMTVLIRRHRQHGQCPRRPTECGLIPHLSRSKKQLQK
jgi:hypothetical protein